MIASLILTSVRLPQPFEMDFALVADPKVNRQLISANGLQSTSADKKLLSYMKAHSPTKQFAIVDGSAPLGDNFSRPNWTVDLSTYKTSSHESGTVTVNGVKVASEHTNQEIAERSVSSLGALGPEHSGTSESLVHDPSSNELLFAMMPLVALRTKSAEIQARSQVGIYVAPLSIYEAEDMAKDLNMGKSQIVICRWGTQKSSTPNLISFPPPGKFKHYKIGYDGTNWYARLQRVISF